MMHSSFNLAYNCAGSLYGFFLDENLGATVESVTNVAETFFENLSSFSSISPDWSWAFPIFSFPATPEGVREAILVSWNLCKEIKKGWIDPHQVLMFRSQIGGNFGFNVYKLHRLRREISQLENQLRRGDLEDEEKREILRNIGMREWQMIVNFLFSLQLPSLFFQVPGSHPWQTIALLVQRAASANFHRMRAPGSFLQLTLDGISIASLSASLARQLEVISLDNAAAQYVIFLATCIGCLQIFYALYTCISAYSR